MALLSAILLSIILLFPVAASAVENVYPSYDMTYLGAFKMPAISGYTWVGTDLGADSNKGLEYLPPNVDCTGLETPYACCTDVGTGTCTTGTLLVLPVRSPLIRELAQVSIPVPVNSKVLGSLNVATLLKGPVDIAGGKVVSGAASLGDVHYLPGKGNQERGHLYWSLYGGYSPPSIFSVSNGFFGWAELDLDNLDPVGMWRFLTCTAAGGVSPVRCCDYAGKYLFHAPQDWADAYTGGRSLLQGYKRAGGGSSTGGVIFAFSPWGVYQPENVAGNDTDSVPPDARNDATPLGSYEIPNAAYGHPENPNHWFEHTKLLQYGITWGVNGVAPPYQVTDAAVNSMWTSARWISLGSKRAIAFAGNQFYRTFENFEWTYGPSFPPILGGGGYQSRPRGAVLWFYSQDDITAVACGQGLTSPAVPPTVCTGGSCPAACAGIATKNVYDPQPYAMINLTPYLINSNDSLNEYQIYGMAYNESENKLYIEEPISSGSLGSVIHVFQLTDVGSSPDVTPPSTPVLTLDSASKTEVQFHWDAITDNSGTCNFAESTTDMGCTTCLIYKNGRPIAIQPCSDTTYTDSYLAYGLSPVDYQVKAIDSSGKSSISTSLSIDNTNGGNAPITIHIPTYYLISHETSAIYLPANVAISITPTVSGGTPPYTWSASSLPAGITINESTGEISGTSTSTAGADHGKTITVTDSVGNKCMRMMTYVRAASICDRDGDGVNGTHAGGCTGADTNDYDGNSTPGANLQATGGVSTVSLSWTAPIARTDATFSPYKRNNTNGLEMGYEVYHGTSPGVYPDSAFVGRSTSYIWTGLTPDSGDHYFVVRAIEFRGLESAYSDPAQVTLGTDTLAPTLQSATIPSAGTTISLAFDEPVTRAAGGTLTISMTGGAVTMTYASGTGTVTLVYSLSRTVYNGETNGTISWDKGAGGFIKDASDNDWASVPSFPVTNNSAQVPISGFNGTAYGAYFAEGYAASYDRGASIVQTSDGGVVMATTTWSYSWVSGETDENAYCYPMMCSSCMMLVKASIDGVESWRKISCSTGFDITTKQITSYDWHANQVIASGTNLIIAGYRDTVSQGTNGSLTKYNSTGVMQWDYEFNSGAARNDKLWDVVDRGGGAGFAAVGTANDGNQTGIWLVLTDADGVNSTQTFYYYLSKGYASGNAIRKTSDGGYIMAGYTQTGVTLDEDYYVVKVSPDGTPEWNQKYDNGGRRDIAYSVEEDASGNFWIIGKSRNGSAENTHIWVVKVNSSGVKQAGYTVVGDSDPANAYIAKNSVKLASGNILILGYTNVSTGSGYHGYLTEINTSGVVQGTPQALSPTTGQAEAYLFSGVVSADGNYYLLAGNDIGSFSTAYDLWYLKMAVSDRSISNTTSCETKTTYYYDKDLDGVGNNTEYGVNSTAQVCPGLNMPGYVLSHSDLNDTSNLVANPMNIGGSMSGGGVMK